MVTEIKENSTNEEKRSLSFVEQLVEEDLAAGKNGGRIQFCRGSRKKTCGIRSGGILLCAENS